MRKAVKIQTVYKFAELSEHAKNNALYHSQLQANYDGEENKATLRAFESIFPVNVRGWEYGECGREYVKWTFTGDGDVEELSDIRLLTYLHNNYRRDLWKGKYYNTPGKHVNGKYTYKSRHSKVIFDNSCVLTGYYMDDDILGPVYEFMRRPDGRTFRDLMEECLESWVSACTSDYEGFHSQESFADMCEVNGWEFTENGSFYN